MHAIEAVYKGHRFRSELEARWAVFLDAAGEPWEYKNEPIRLLSGPYLPGFWLPKFDCWLEIKASRPTAREVRLCEELASEKAVVVAWGLPEVADRWSSPSPQSLMIYCYDSTRGGTMGLQWWSEAYWSVLPNSTRELCLCTGEDTDRDHRQLLAPGYTGIDKICFVKEVDSDGIILIEHFADAANSFRFG